MTTTIMIKPRSRKLHPHTKRTMSSCTNITSLLLVLLLSMDSFRLASSYVTGTVPHQRQVEWLKRMTSTICTKTPGHLSTREISQGHELMYAWSHLETRRHTKEAALAVESLVKRVIDEQRAGNVLAETTLEDYNCLLEGWARADCGIAAAERCEQILHGMQEQGPKPNLSSFKVVLMAWRQAKDCDYAPIRAQRVLEWMIRLVQTQENLQALPDSDCFDIVLQTWSNSGRKDAPKKAEKLMGVMERMYEETGFPILKPRTTSFNAVLSAWCKSSAHYALERATDVLSFMELLESRGDAAVAPDRASYAIVMGALTKSCSKDKALAANRADVFLQHVEDGFYQGKRTLAPDTLLYNTAMGCWAKSNVPGAYKRTRAILNRQIALHAAGNCPRCKPDVYGYTSVIASCAGESGHKKDKLRAFDVALRTFREIQTSSYLHANHVTYGTMLKACGKLLPSSSPIRKQVSREVFETACADGCVGDMVLSRFREAASPECYRQLMDGRSRRDLPSDWTRNVHEKNEYRSKRTHAPSSKRQSAEV
ncbi:hypothetical protein MPSEU_000557500 [Mayamaea pseudoterrestris]|nr:hypothetical protein MPSEU_000557500 [Mayamaea pseudoterrestris]